MKQRSTMLLLSALIASGTLSHSTITYAKTPEADFKLWLISFKDKARQQGISERTLSLALDSLELSKKVIKSDRKQPEFSRTFFEYLNRAVSKTRIENGRQNYQKHQKILQQVERKYGVPAHYITAFWGMETNYGGFTGNLPIIQSLATLAYDPRRSEFFSQELMAALKILDRGDVSLDEMKGSWAGAMGQVQFMPSNYLKYAVDGDGDGKINLWASLPDAFHSAGNFLQHLGWNAQTPWGHEVALTENFDFALADNKTERSVAEWKKLGVKLLPHLKLADHLKAKLVLPSDYRGPAFLAFNNYQVIKRWNNSTNYAIGVGYLAQRIIKEPELTKKQPKDDKGLSKEQVKQIQSLLNQLGFNAGKPDGIAGSNTRSALRAFQSARKLPADGFPSRRMLEHLRKAAQ